MATLSSIEQHSSEQKITFPLKAGLWNAGACTLSVCALSAMNPIAGALFGVTATLGSHLVHLICGDSLISHIGVFALRTIGGIGLGTLAATLVGFSLPFSTGLLLTGTWIASNFAFHSFFGESTEEDSESVDQNKKLYPGLDEKALVNGLYEMVQPSGNLIDQFPSELINAMGRKVFMNLPEVRGIEKVSFAHLPQSGAIKGTDKRGQAFVAFVVRNPNYQSVKREFREEALFGIEPAIPVEEMVITLRQERASYVPILQKALGFPVKEENSFVFQRYYAKEFGIFTDFSHLRNLPTTDSRLLVTSSLKKETYKAIQEIFQGRHKDLQRVTSFKASEVALPQQQS